MEIALTIVHVFICFALVVSILLQAGKGGGLAGSAFGGASTTMFGGAGASSALGKVTTYLAVGFFITCIGLWYTSRSGDTLPQTAAERMLGERPMPLQGAAVPQPLGESAPAAADVEAVPESSNP